MSQTQRTAGVEQAFFQSKPCLKSHVFLLKNEEKKYVETLGFLCRSGAITMVSAGVKSRVLAALHICKQHKAVTALLQHCEVVDVSKAVNLLDRNRKMRQLEQRIETIEKAHPHIVLDEAMEDEDEASTKKHKKNGKKKRKDVTMSDGKDAPKKRNRRRQVDKYRRAKRALETEQDACPGLPACAEAHADSATAEFIQSGSSVSGALARKIRQWAKTTLRSDFLEFVLLALPLESWKQLADLVHFAPSDFAVPYFLDYVHRDGKKDSGKDDDAMTTTPDHNFVTSMRRLLKTLEDGNKDSEIVEQFLAIAKEFPQVYLNYSLIRRYPQLTGKTEIMMRFAESAPVDTIIWFFEEFHRASSECQHIVSERILRKENGMWSVNSKATYGKLVERILTLRRMGVTFANDLIPMAEARLEELRSFWRLVSNSNGGKKKVAVFGDASSSMQNAIEAASIFASMVSVCFDGELSFFATDFVPSPYAKPCNTEQALEVCTKVRAYGATSLAAALWPYYERKEWVDMIVMVTDEEENTPKNGYSFSSLLAKYRQEVNPNVSLVIVCVGRGDQTFRANLAKYEIDHKVVEVDGARPDHAKFDALLGQLALLTMTMEGQAPEEEATDGGWMSICDDSEFVVV